MTANSAVPARSAVTSTSPAGGVVHSPHPERPARGARPARRRRTRRRHAPRDAVAISARFAGSSSRASNASATACRIVGPVDDEPGDAVVDRLGSAARLAGDLRHPARRGLDEHDAEALLLQPAPPGAAGHGEHVAAPVQRRAGRSLATRPRKRTGALRSAARRRRRRSSRPPPEIASTRSGRRGASRATASMATSKPLRGTSREIDTISSPSVGRPKCAAGGEPFVGVERAEALGVDAGRHDGHGQLVLGGALGLRARRSGRPR